MPAHKRYQTQQEKKAAKQVTYARYYAKNWEAINARRRERYKDTQNPKQHALSNKSRNRKKSVRHTEQKKLRNECPAPPNSPSVPLEKSQCPHSPPPPVSSAQVSLRVIEQMFNDYVAKIGRSWPRFFDGLANSYLRSNDCTEIDDQYDLRWKHLEIIQRQMKVLMINGSQAGDMAAIAAGQGMVDRMGEIVQKLCEFSHATILGSNQFQCEMEEGMLTW
ncbi:hypothetical protein GYMLUDRAFT_64026 [Collybiopsis luxurians FD-317 M1]|uniref:Uncharacterized protein n=1 Tax=Collybiopsis luxurians FD-317 M1 TaxID=944289 RepID=A0A0D0CD80_9AGAR|nr:hypothetical protein GYMLUDRAFT_64026 [Collybiopsis luxurians FD-317 M1]